MTDCLQAGYNTQTVPHHYVLFVFMVSSVFIRLQSELNIIIFGLSELSRVSLILWVIEKENGWICRGENAYRFFPAERVSPHVT